MSPQSVHVRVVDHLVHTLTAVRKKTCMFIYVNCLCHLGNMWTSGTKDQFYGSFHFLLNFHHAYFLFRIPWFFIEILKMFKSICNCLKAGRRSLFTNSVKQISNARCEKLIYFESMGSYLWKHKKLTRMSRLDISINFTLVCYKQPQRHLLGLPRQPEMVFPTVLVPPSTLEYFSSDNVETIKQCSPC